jgi:hypothetical protein
LSTFHEISKKVEKKAKKDLEIETTYFKIERRGTADFCLRRDRDV